MANLTSIDKRKVQSKIITNNILFKCVLFPSSCIYSQFRDLDENLYSLINILLLFELGKFNDAIGFYCDTVM